MLFSKKDHTNVGLHEFKMCASKIPTKEEPQPAIYTSNVFAKNSVAARAVFAKLLNKQYKLKLNKMVVLKNVKVKQDNDFKVKNYRISCVFASRTGKQNATKEVRHINRVCAVSAFNQEFGSRHKVRASDISIISVDEITAEEATKPKVLAYTAEGVKFPLFKKIPNTANPIVSVTEKIFK